MRSVSLTMFRFFTVLVFGFPLLTAQAQENSPYSRYGMGDFFHGQHIISSSMGGLAAAYADGTSNNNGQSINFSNPAAYSNLFMVSFDFSLTVDSRTLRSNDPSGKFVSNYFVPAYFALGMPLNKKRGIGLAFGLKPLSRISYSVTENGRAAGDSIARLYSGSGGLNQAFIGMGKRWKGLSVGFNTGVNFGRKDISTMVAFVNDTIAYKQSKSSTVTNFGGLFLSGGTQYEFPIKSITNLANKTVVHYFVRLGVSGNLSQSLNAKQNIDRATVSYTSTGAVTTIDTVFSQSNIKGTIQMPSSYAAGITFRKAILAPRGLFDLWSVGAEYTATKWSQYRFYNQTDQVSDNWQFKLGAQFAPDPVSGNGYWGNVNYRVGFFTGQDYATPGAKSLKTTGGTMGMGLPIRKWSSYSNQFTILNLGLQFGKRGTSVNNITEGFFRLSVGVSLSDIWFIPHKYD
ncbi:MAG: hypothetical protein D4R41_03995 [Sediminibacterium sp.]|nr:MAG: hypothetical protein D4R41_03995 [Sediminibacterium sp.]